MLTPDSTLRRFFAKRPCTACHRRQTPETVLILVQRKESSMVLVTCANCHHRGIYVVSTANQAKSIAAGSPIQPITSSSSPISTDDVREMRHFLTTFDGDFASLFGKGPHGHLATE
jgi:predicted RNA-binding protein YlxR (DUF448 family)